MKLKTKSTSVIRIALLVLIAMILGVNLYTLNASRLVGNAVPMPFGIGAAVVLSGSMEPELSEGDLLLIAEKESYEVGDVVVYQDGQTAITHRIVFITDEQIITKGDANNTNDPPITPKQIKGTVICAIPWVGHIISAIKSPVGTVSILVLAILLLERSFYTEKQRDKQELEIIQAEIEKLKQEQNKKS